MISIQELSKIASARLEDPKVLKEGLKYIADRVQESLEAEELLQLSRIVVIDKDNPALEAITRAISSKHAITEVQDSNFFGLPIQHAYVITSQRPNVTASAIATT